MSPAKTPDHRKRMFRYDQHMPEIDDLTLTVLKGHLLVEEALYGLANSALPHPEYLKKAGLTFHKLVHVIRAFVCKKSEDACWELILKLNAIRNGFAHKLELPNLQNQLHELFKRDEKVQPWPG